MKTFYEMLPILAEARAPKGTPTSLNVWVMFDSLEKGGGVISDRVESVDLVHLRRCLEAGFLERGASGGFVPTQKGIEAMEKELAVKMSRDPDYKRPKWMGLSVNENYPNSEVNHEFLNAAGEARQKLADVHRVLDRNRDPQHRNALVNYMKNARAQLGKLLVPFDRKPVLGGLEFRIANEGSLQLFVVDNRMGQDVLEKMIMDGQIDELVQKVEGAEESLANWFRSSSARHRENPSMIGS